VESTDEGSRERLARMGTYLAANFSRLPLPLLCQTPVLILLSQIFGFRSEARKASDLLLEGCQPGLECGDDCVCATFVCGRGFSDRFPPGTLRSVATARPVNTGARDIENGRIYKAFHGCQVNLGRRA